MHALLQERQDVCIHKVNPKHQCFLTLCTVGTAVCRTRARERQILCPVRSHFCWGVNLLQGHSSHPAIQAITFTAYSQRQDSDWVAEPLVLVSRGITRLQYLAVSKALSPTVQHNLLLREALCQFYASKRSFLQLSESLPVIRDALNAKGRQPAPVNEGKTSGIAIKGDSISQQQALCSLMWNTWRSLPLDCNHCSKVLVAMHNLQAVPAFPSKGLDPRGRNLTA